MAIAAARFFCPDGSICNCDTPDDRKLSLSEAWSDSRPALRSSSGDITAGDREVADLSIVTKSDTSANPSAIIGRGSVHDTADD